MPRPPRADGAGELYHVLLRGNLRAKIFHKEADYEAFERILYEALQVHQIGLYSFQLMPNHYHDDWPWSSLWRWLRKPEPTPPLLSSWPLPRLPGWTERVNAPLSQQELAAVRLSAQRSKPLGDEGWGESITRRLNLKSTIRPRGRKRVRLPKPVIKEACPFDDSSSIWSAVIRHRFHLEPIGSRKTLCHGRNGL